MRSILHTCALHEVLVAVFAAAAMRTIVAVVAVVKVTATVAG